LLPQRLAEPLVGPAASAVLQRPVSLHLALWHGIGPTFLMEVGTLAVGIVLFLWLGKRPISYPATLPAWGPARWYDWSIRGLLLVAQWQTRFLQGGRLRGYLLITLLAATGLVAYPLVGQWRLASLQGWSDVRFYEAGLVVLILLGATATVRSQSRLGAVAALGVVGYSVATIFVFFGAPDLAMTQFVIETLMVILFVLVFYHLPPFAVLTNRAVRTRDALVALGAGLVMTSLVLIATNVPADTDVSDYYRQHSFTAAHGRNIVNVILVDFRAGDTLGEITVLAIAGAGVFALLKFRQRERSG
jgi:multicomponent Na+:H+ antiporter subunit A